MSKKVLTNLEYTNILQSAFEKKNSHPNLRWGQCFFDALYESNYVDQKCVVDMDNENGLYEIIDCGTCQYLVSQLIEEED